jgi:hypothetical protein
MTGVSQILAQLAENAGKARLVQGQIYGNAVAAASQVPAQILDDQERQQQIDFQRARDVQQMGLALRADQRATADQAYQDTTRAQELKDRTDWKTIAGVMYNPDGTYNYPAAYQKAYEIGRPDLGDQVQKHAEMTAPKIGEAAAGTAGRFLTGPHRGELVPNSTVPPKGPEAGTDAYRIATRIQDIEGTGPSSAPPPAPGAPPPGPASTYAGRADLLQNGPPPSTVPAGGPGAPATTAAPLAALAPPTTLGAPAAAPPAAAPPPRLTHAQAVAKAYADAEAAKDPILALYTKRASGATLTPDETAQIAGYEAKKNADDAPVTIKTIENGRMVEKVMTRADALKAGLFPSQPPASVQVQNMPPPPSRPANKAEIAIANYQVPPPSPRTFATPAGQAMLDRILTVNPDYDQSLYAVRAPTRKAYTTGTQGQQLVAIGTAIQHLDLLQQAADALNNGTLKPGNAIYNALADTFGGAAPTTFDTIKEKVDKELDAVAQKGAPTVSGSAAQKAIGGRSGSPAAIKSYIDSSIQLMGGSYNALRTPYQGAMGANAPFEFLSPEAKAVLSKRGFDPDNPNATFNATPGAGATPGGPAAPAGRGAGPGAPITVTDPKGDVHTFATQAQAEIFKAAIAKAAAGIK